MLISDEYRAMNVKLHEARSSFGAGGKQYARDIIDFARQINAVTILDYGCGKGTLKPELLDYEVTEYDPAIAGKDVMPGPAELVVCCDVLEHVEPECLDEVIEHIASLGTRGFYFIIASRPANKRLPDGRNAHLIQKGAAYWQKDLQKHLRIVRGKIDTDHHYAVRAVPLESEA
jgi:hypothetical protein